MKDGMVLRQLINKAIEKGLMLQIDYVNNKRERSLRIISKISISPKYSEGYITAYCHIRKEERTFRISNIVDADIFDLTKPIFNLYGDIY